MSQSLPRLNSSRQDMGAENLVAKSFIGRKCSNMKHQGPLSPLPTSTMHAFIHLETPVTFSETITQGLDELFIESQRNCMRDGFHFMSIKPARNAARDNTAAVDKVILVRETKGIFPLGHPDWMSVLNVPAGIRISNEDWANFATVATVQSSRTYIST